MRKVFFVGIILSLLLIPVLTSAALFPIVTCGGTNANGTAQVLCTPCSLFATFKNIIDLVLYGITGPIAAFMIVWAGGMMLLGGGKPALYAQGKELLKNTLIGVSIILLAWVVTNFLIKSLITGNQGDNWYQFSCPAGLSAITPIETALPTGGPQPVLPAPTEIEPRYAGVAAVGGISGGLSGGGGSTYSTCNIGVECPGKTTPQCQKFAPLMRGENASILMGIMINESSCMIKPTEAGKGAYGIMQMKPETANANRRDCDVTETINAAWLRSEQNVDKIFCVANNFVNSLKRQCGTNPLNIAGGYNGGPGDSRNPGACTWSQDCKSLPSCTDGGPMRAWECPWSDPQHKYPDKGFLPTREYAPKVAACAQ